MVLVLLSLILAPVAAIYLQGPILDLVNPSEGVQFLNSGNYLLAGLSVIFVPLLINLLWIKSYDFPKEDYRRFVRNHLITLLIFLPFMAMAVYSNIDVTVTCPHDWYHWSATRNFDHLKSQRSGH